MFKMSTLDASIWQNVPYKGGTRLKIVQYLFVIPPVFFRMIKIKKIITCTIISWFLWHKFKLSQKMFFLLKFHENKLNL